MRLRDVGLRRRQTRLIYTNHRPSPWLIEASAPRSLQPIVRQTVPYNFIPSQMTASVDALTTGRRIFGQNIP
jgi:hypothetical protein